MKFTKEDITIGNVFCLVAPALQFMQFQLAGVLTASDLVLLAALPVAVIRHPARLKQRPLPTILMLGVLWLVAQVITDVVRNSSPADYLRGWSKVSLTLAHFVVLWTVVCGSRRRFLLYTVGLAVGGILSFYVQPTDGAIASPWKFGVGAAVTLLIVTWVAVATEHRYIKICLAALVLVAVHSFEDYRSLALICFATAVYSVFLMSTSSERREFAFLRMVALAVTVVCGLWIFTLVYSHYAEQGAFGEYARFKLEAQSGDGGLLLGGRNEILASGQAILDSPLLGHGSWARDSTYAAILSEKQAELGYKNLGGKKDDLIPTHSHIFGAWVEGGAAGGLFWIFVISYTIRALMKASGSEPLLPLFAFAGFMLLWDILFSPLGIEHRLNTTYYMAAVMIFNSLAGSQPVLAEEAF